MIQIHSNTILSMGVNPIIKAHDSNPWQIIYQKPSSRWQHQKPNFHWQHRKAQFSLAISKVQFSLATSKSPVLTSNIKKPNFHWQH